jgi:creatinine amidohydrolase/Fe(II)-dependent formamide hydrolase-like protein
VEGRILFAKTRDDRPGLREPPGGPLPVAQPSRVDELRAAKFSAYRERAAAAQARVADPAASVARRGRAEVAEALRRCRDAS